LLNDPAQESAATQRADEMKRTATSANLAFAAALLKDAEGRANRALAGAPAADPSVQRLNDALSSLRLSVQGSANVVEPGQSIAAARDALAKSLAVASAIPDVNRAQQAARKQTQQETRVQTATATTAIAPTTTAPQAATTAATTAPAASTGNAAAKRAQLNSIVQSGRSMARQVIQSGNKENARLAKNYDKYLATLENSGRGVRTDRELDQLIKQANQTKAYLSFLTKQ